MVVLLWSRRRGSSENPLVAGDLGAGKKNRRQKTAEDSPALRISSAPGPKYW